MDIVKRNKKTVIFNPQKLIKRLKQYPTDVDLRKYIDKAVIDCQKFFYDGITTAEIDTRLAQCVSQFSILEPEMAYLGGYIIITSLEKDIASSKYNYINTPVLKEYFVSRYLTWTRPTSSQPRMSYFAAYTMKQEFLLRNEFDEVIETPKDFYWRIAVATAKTEQQAVKFYKELLYRGFATSNPISVNSGTSKGKLISCTTMTVADSREGIKEAMNSASDHSANNSGLGIYIGDIRSKETSRSRGGKASGIRRLVKTLTPLSGFFRQHSKRRGAFAMYCDIWHKDILDFIPMKRQDLPHSVTDQDGFYAVSVPDLFYKRFEQKADWSLFCPQDVFKAYGWRISDFTGEEFETKYLQIESEGKVEVDTIASSELMMQLVDAMAASGVPYVYNRDNANKNHQQKHLGVLKSYQLCVSGDTQMTALEGKVDIKDLAGTEAVVWNGQEFSKTKFFKTGENKELLEVFFSNGESLKCTPNHRFFIKGLGEVEAGNLKINSTLEDYEIPLGDDIITPVSFNVKVTKIIKLEGLHDTYCGTEPKINRLLFNGIQASNCIEFAGMHNAEIEAQCDLGSIPLPSHIIDKEFNFTSLKQSVKTLVRLLNNVIDINEWNTEKARKGGLEHRNIGIGMIGLADVFAMLDLTYGCEKSRVLNEEIQKTIYLSALEESNLIAKETGLGFKETLVCREPQEWIPEELKASLKEHGVMNHLLCCNMPTSTTSKLLDITQSFEVFDFPVSYRETVLGEFKQVNKHLVKDLKELGVWNDENAMELVRKNNVVDLDFIPQHIKDKYTDKYRHSNKVYLEMAAGRQKYIDQGQSMNLYYDKPERSKISTALYYGWKLGLPSGSYYTTILKQKDDNNLIAKESKQEVVKPQGSNFECFGCD